MLKSLCFIKLLASVSWCSQNNWINSNLRKRWTDGEGEILKVLQSTEGWRRYGNHSPALITKSRHRAEAARRGVHKQGSVEGFCVPIVCLRDELSATSAAACELLSDGACACKSQLSPTRCCHSCIHTPLHWKVIFKKKKGEEGGGCCRDRECSATGGRGKEDQNLKVMGNDSAKLSTYTVCRTKVLHHTA